MLSISRLFLARGADVDAKNKENDTPIEVLRVVSYTYRHGLFKCSIFTEYIFSATLILQCCIDENSQSALALKVNKQLKGFAAARLGRTERLIDR